MKPYLFIGQGGEWVHVMELCLYVAWHMHKTRLLVGDTCISCRFNVLPTRAAYVSSACEQRMWACIFAHKVWIMKQSMWFMWSGTVHVVLQFSIQKQAICYAVEWIHWGRKHGGGYTKDDGDLGEDSHRRTEVTFVCAWWRVTWIYQAWDVDHGSIRVGGKPGGDGEKVGRQAVFSPWLPGLTPVWRMPWSTPSRRLWRRRHQSTKPRHAGKTSLYRLTMHWMKNTFVLGQIWVVYFSYNFGAFPNVYLLVTN